MIEFEKGTPAWRQVAACVRRMVSEGRFMPGDAIPSARRLARALSTSAATVEFAYQQLIAAGILVSRRRKGTYVALVPNGLHAVDREQLLACAAIEFARNAALVGASLREAIDHLSAARRFLEYDAEGAAISQAVCRSPSLTNAKN